MERAGSATLDLVQNALDAVPAYVAILDAGGLIAAVNTAWRRYERAHPLLGRSLGVGADLPGICRATPGMDPVAALLERVARGEAEEASDEYAVGEGDETAWFQVRVSRLVGLAGGAVLVSQLNVTEARRAEEALRRSQERLFQAQKMEAVGQLAGGVAHDFNNILTAILGYSELLLERLDAGHPGRRHAEQIKSGGERAAELTKQLLAFSRRQMFEIKTVNVNEIVRSITGMLDRLLGENIRQETALAHDLGFVRVDAGQMGQVILNLSVNARDAMPHGGRLVLETSNIEADETYAAGHPEMRPGPYVLLAVSDTGSGMTPEVLAHLFEPFFTTKEPGKGTGLGLATVFGIVKQSGGHIWVYSEAGNGTTFRIHLPRVAAPGAGPAHGDGAAGALRRGTETVLVVEDEAMIRSLARTILERCGYAVLDAESAESAMALATGEARPVDLLLTDVVMPGRNGVDLAAELRRRYPGLRVVFMSGYTNNVVLHHGVSHASMAFIQKPFTQRTLTDKVRDTLDAG